MEQEAGISLKTKSYSYSGANREWNDRGVSGNAGITAYTTDDAVNRTEDCLSDYVSESRKEVGRYVPINIPENLKEYADELRLLNGVPLTYLLTEASDLPEESIRFFVLDINWTDALLDGAFSIGRVCKQDALSDKTTLNAVGEDRCYANMPRIRRMHANHRENLLKNGANGSTPEDYRMVSGFLLRSRLVNEKKGLHLYGYDKAGAPKDNMDNGTPLSVLRMETIADNVLLALFHGEVYQIMIEEPKTGLRFGAASTDVTTGKISRSIDLRSAQDSAELGKRVGSFCIDRFTEENGRLHVGRLADALENELKTKDALGAERITPSRFAFEMIAVAHRVRLTAADN